MSPKLDFQKLRDCLSKCFIVGSLLTTKIMSKNYLKIDGVRLIARPCPGATHNNLPAEGGAPAGAGRDRRPNNAVAGAGQGLRPREWRVRGGAAAGVAEVGRAATMTTLRLQPGQPGLPPRARANAWPRSVRRPRRSPQRPWRPPRASRRPHGHHGRGGRHGSRGGVICLKIVRIKFLLLKNLLFCR